MKRVSFLLLPLTGLLWACSSDSPVTGEGGLVPIDVKTVEVRLAFSEFADSLQILGGYSTQDRLPSGVIARAFGGLEAHVMIRFGPPADRISVFPQGGGLLETDSLFHPVGGRMVVYMDTASVVGAPPLDFEGAAVQTPWDVGSSSWEMAVDTVGNQTMWPTPGGEPVVVLGPASWAGPDEGDSLSFDVDSMTADHWFDSGRPENGARISLLTDGARVPLVGADFRYQVRSFVNPDTIVEVDALTAQITFVYDPSEPPADPGRINIGGAPARRALVHFNLPDEVNGPPELCAVVACPLDLRPERLVFGGLELTARDTSPAGLAPLDSIGIDMRPVLAPERLPRSPLGQSVRSVPYFLAPDLFSGGGETVVQLTMTTYIRDLLRDPGSGVPTVMAVLTPLEPWSLEYATFWGPGTALEPVLRMVFTVAPDLPLP